MEMLRGILKEELQNSKRRIFAFKNALKELPAVKESNPKRKHCQISIKVLKLQIRFLKRVLRAKEFYQARKLTKK